MSEQAPTAEIDVVRQLLARAWQKGYEAHEADADDWENGSIPAVRHRRASANPYLSLPPGPDAYIWHTPEGDKWLHPGEVTRVLPPGSSEAGA